MTDQSELSIPQSHVILIVTNWFPKQHLPFRQQISICQRVPWGDITRISLILFIMLSLKNKVAKKIILRHPPHLPLVGQTDSPAPKPSHWYSQIFSNRYQYFGSATVFKLFGKVGKGESNKNSPPEPMVTRVSQTLVIIWKGLFKAVSLTLNSGSP